MADGWRVQLAHRDRAGKVHESGPPVSEMRAISQVDNCPTALAAHAGRWGLKRRGVFVVERKWLTSTGGYIRVGELSGVAWLHIIAARATSGPPMQTCRDESAACFGGRWLFCHL